MRRISTASIATTFTLLSLGLGLPAAADELIPSGGEIQVNSYTPDNQGFPEIAVAPDGQFVIVWESFGQDTLSWGVFGQRFAANGSPVGGELPVNTTTDDTEWDPSVAIGSDGSFVVAWHAFTGVLPNYDVRARVFDSAGNPVTGELVVNSHTPGYQGNTSVAVADSGDFLVVWESDAQDLSDGGVYGQLFDSAGTPIGDELRLNTTTAADQNDVRVAARDGGFAVVWESYLQDGSNEATILQFLDAMGGTDGAELVVNSHTTGDQEDADIAIASDGSFAVVWESDGQDGAGEGAFAQVYDSSGVAMGGELQLNTYTLNDQKDPTVAPDGTGGFIAVWTSVGQLDGTSDEIYGQRIDAGGNAVGDEFRVNSQATDNQDKAVIAGGPGGRAMVAWRSFGAHDGSAAGVFAQQLAVALFADGFETGDTTDWSSTSP